MRKKSLLLSTMVIVLIVMICLGTGITKNRITRLLIHTSLAVPQTGAKPIASSRDKFSSPQSTKKLDITRDKIDAFKLSAAISDIKLISTKLTRSAAFQQKIDKLVAKAQKRGTVPVIVTLNVAYRPETTFQDNIEQQAQLQSISESRQSLLSSVKHNPASLKTYDDLPFVALSVDAESLFQLQLSPDVLDITEDKPMKLAAHQSLPLIGATKAWAGGITGTGQTVVILDSGVDKTHPALSGKVVAEACFSTNNSTGASSLCPSGSLEAFGTDSGKNCTDSELTGLGACDHGTHIANLAAGRYGVAPNANIISMQVMSKSTNSGECGIAPCLLSYTSDVIKALNYVYTDLRNSNTIASVNISLAYDENVDPNGYTSYCDADFPQLKTAIDNLRSVNIPTIIAAGNEGFTDALSYPACISSAISVGATGDNSPSSRPNGQRILIDKVPNFSNSAPYLNFLAPGSAISSAVPGGGFQSGDGTSMATAHVTGAMALLREKYPNGFSNTLWFDDALPAGATVAPDDTAGGGGVMKHGIGYQVIQRQTQELWRTKHQ